MRLACINATGGGMSGGYRRYFQNVLPRLAAHPSVTAILSAAPSSVGVEQWFPSLPKVQFVSCQPFRFLHHRPEAVFVQSVRAFEPDVIFMPIERFLSFPGIPFVTMLQNMGPLLPVSGNPLSERLRYVAQRFETRLALRRASHIIAPTDFVRTFLNKEWHIQTDRITMIHYGSASEESTAKRPKNIPEDWEGKFLFTAGSISPYRGIEDIIDAMRLLPNTVKLVIAGEVRLNMVQYQQYLMRRIVRHGLQARIRWVGNLSSEAMLWCYQQSIVFVMTSRIESFGMIGVEALAEGALCIVADNPPLPEIFDTAAWYYPPKNEKALAKKINEALSLEGTARLAMSEAARQRAATFSWDSNVEQLVSILINTASQKKSTTYYSTPTYETQLPVFSRIEKLWRYIQLYGFSRTITKARGRYHMKKEYAVLPVIKRHNKRAHVGIIGCGNFSYTTIAYYLKKNFGNVVHGVMDINPHKAASLASSYKANYYTTNADKILNDSDITIVFIASNHASHAEYAIKALERGKSVHIEKPHIVNEDQLVRLCRAIQNNSGKVRIGFPRPNSNFIKLIQQHLAPQPGGTIMSWFIVGQTLPPDHWYYKKEEGGRILGNLTHWIDCTYHLVAPLGRFPLTIVPLRHTTTDHDVAVNYLFGDETIATISFSAKGYTFEGVREQLTLQKGNVFVRMHDFQYLSIEEFDKKILLQTRLRDQGHEAAIIRSYGMASPRNLPGEDVAYIWETGLLMLKTKEALETNTTVTMQPYQEDVLTAR